MSMFLFFFTIFIPGFRPVRTDRFRCLSILRLCVKHVYKLIFSTTSPFHWPPNMSQSDSNKSTITFLTSNKKKRLLALHGYIYQQNKSTTKVTYWICEERMCWAGVHLDSNDQFLKYTKATHNHLPTPEREEIRKMMASIKDRVTSETKAIGQIYNEELSRTNLSEAALATAHTASQASKSKVLCFLGESDNVSP